MNDIDEILMAFYVNHGDVVVDPEFVLKQKQALLSTIKASLPEKIERPVSGPNRNGNSEGVRKAYNRGISEVEDYLDSLFDEGSINSNE